MTQLLPKPERQTESLGKGRSQRSSQLRLLIPIALLLTIGGLGVWYFLSRPAADELKFSGRVEGYETDVGAKVAGRVEEVTVREGAEVQKGQLLARLDDDEIRAQLAGADARVRVAQQEAQNARLQSSVLESQIAEAQYRLQQSQSETTGQVSQAEAEVATAIAQLRQAEAQVTEAEAELELAREDVSRYADLVQQGAVTQQRYQQAQTTFSTAQAALESRRASVIAAQRQVNAAQGALTQARSTSLNPSINTAQINRLNTQLQQTQVQIKQAQAEVANAQADRQRIQAQLSDLTIKSPITGVVTTRTVEPGVVVSPGKILLTLLDLNTVYMRGFIPEGQIGSVRVGQPALVYLDSDPDRPLQARVSAIDSEASFTPENIYFREDRVQQVFGVRLTIEEPGGFAKPGMPADAEIVLP